jgi:hypothetical protein
MTYPVLVTNRLRRKALRYIMITRTMESGLYECARSSQLSRSSIGGGDNHLFYRHEWVVVKISSLSLKKIL